MAKVVIEFDPTIPGELAAVAQLFYTTYRVEQKSEGQNIARLDENVLAVVTSKKRGRPPRAKAALELPPTSAPERKACEQCGKEFERAHLTSKVQFAKQRYCGKTCFGAAARERNLLSSEDRTRISPERDSHGKTKYCQKCAMFLWKRYDHRRSQLNPDLCDSCGGDLDSQPGELSSPIRAINPANMGEVSS